MGLNGVNFSRNQFVGLYAELSRTKGIAWDRLIQFEEPLSLKQEFYKPASRNNIQIFDNITLILAFLAQGNINKPNPHRVQTKSIGSKLRGCQDLP